MENKFITLDKTNIDSEHICCAFSDKKCQEGYSLKKEWLKCELGNGYVFRKLNERAKVFMEYGPAEKAWAPIKAPDYLMINCFWVSGQYKGKGYAKELLRLAISDAESQNKKGLVTIAGIKKLPFTSDTKWLKKQGFEIVETLPYGFCLLSKKLNDDGINPSFLPQVATGECPHKEGIVVYYSNRCPFTEFHVHHSLTEATKEYNIPLKIIKIKTMEQAQKNPCPTSIFSLFYNGRYVTNDISICLKSKFRKILTLE